MSNKSKHKATPQWAEPGHKSKAQQQQRERKLWIVFGVVAVLLVIGAAVIALAAGGDDDKQVDPTGKIQQNRTVDVVSGSPLAKFDSPQNDTEIGKTAPVVSGSSFDGSFVRLAPQDGKFLMVVFVAHWCPHCQIEVPRLVDWYNSGVVPSTLDVVGVSTATDQARGNWTPSEWLEKEGWPWKVLADDKNSTAGANFGLATFPYFVIISPDGQVVARDSGEKTVAQLEAIVDAAMKVN